MITVRKIIRPFIQTPPIVRVANELYRILLLAPLLSGEMVLSIISIAGFALATMAPFPSPRSAPSSPPKLPRHQTILGHYQTRRIISNLLEGEPEPQKLLPQPTESCTAVEAIEEKPLPLEELPLEELSNEELPLLTEQPTESVEEEVIDEESHFWLSTRERADAIFALCPLYDELLLQKLPLSILLGGADHDALSTLSSDQLDGAMALKEEIDALCTVFDFDESQALLDHVFYCSIRQQREQGLRYLLSTITPMVMESLDTAEDEKREALYLEIVHQLVDNGEFLSSERDELISKWHQEYSPTEVPTTPQPIEEPVEALLEELATELTPDERLGTDETVVEPTQQSGEVAQEQELEPHQEPDQEPHQEASRDQQIDALNSLSLGHGLSLNTLLKQLSGATTKEREPLLNQLLSARSDLPEEYAPYHGHLRGCGADLLIESLLRIQLQSRVCHLYREYRHLRSYEHIEQQIFSQLESEFGAVVIRNHRTAIMTHIEWSSSEEAPCAAAILRSGS